VKADLPDLKLEDISVLVENQTLSIRGERRFEDESNGKGYHRIERGYGNFVRSFTVPNTVDTENVSADYKNGVLTVKLPKKAAAKPRQVKVEVKQ
jgi:HSP20 family protein